MEPIIDHIQITVKDMSIAVPFYDKLLPVLGFDIQNKVSALIEEHEFHVVEYTHPRLTFAITSPRTAFADGTINRRKPGALHHLAFKAESRAEVDRLHSEVKGIGATIVSPPQEYPEYTPRATTLSTSRIWRVLSTRLCALNTTERRRRLTMRCGQLRNYSRAGALPGVLPRFI
jgi:catechol 2,3-dioxygenase-like lactoylglutathione lyase family enzyme